MVINVNFTLWLAMLVVPHAVAAPVLHVHPAILEPLQSCTITVEDPGAGLQEWEWRTPEGIGSLCPLPGGASVLYQGAEVTQPQTITVRARAKGGDDSAWISATLQLKPSMLGARHVRIGRMYVTQAAQRPDGSVPLIEGRMGFLRIFPVADREGLPAPSIRIRVRNAEGVLLYDTIFDSQSHRTPPLHVDEESMEGSFVKRVPENLIKPGYTFQAAIVPDPQDPDQTPRYQSIRLNVQPAIAMSITLVPVRFGAHTGHVESEPSQLAASARFATGVIPVQDLHLLVGPTFTTQLGRQISEKHTLDDLLLELLAKRIQDPPGSQYDFGLFPKALVQGSEAHGQALMGIPGQLPERVAVVWDHFEAGKVDGRFAFGLAHELGHLLGLEHPNRNGTAGSYPHPDGTIGVSGFHVLGDEFIASQTPEFMNPEENAHSSWVSDYHWEKMVEFLERDAAAQKPIDLAVPAKEQALLIWGSLHKDILELRPVLRVPAENAVPPIPGPMAIHFKDRDGKVLLELPFQLLGKRDADGKADGFALFTVPVALFQGQEDRLASFSLLPSGPEGDPTAHGLEQSLQPRQGSPSKAPSCSRIRGAKARLAWDDHFFAMVSVKDSATGEVLAMGWRSPLDLDLDPKVEELTLGFPDGIKPREVRVAVKAGKKGMEAHAPTPKVTLTCLLAQPVLRPGQACRFQARRSDGAGVTWLWTLSGDPEPGSIRALPLGRAEYTAPANGNGRRIITIQARDAANPDRQDAMEVVVEPEPGTPSPYR